MFTEPEVWPEVLLGQQRGSKSDQSKFAILLQFLGIKYHSVTDSKKFTQGFFLTFN